MLAFIKLRGVDIASLPPYVLAHEFHWEPDHHRGHRPLEVGQREVVRQVRGRHRPDEFLGDVVDRHPMVDDPVDDGLRRDFRGKALAVGLAFVDPQDAVEARRHALEAVVAAGRDQLPGFQQRQPPPFQPVVDGFQPVRHRLQPPLHVNLRFRFGVRRRNCRQRVLARIGRQQERHGDQPSFSRGASRLLPLQCRSSACADHRADRRIHKGIVAVVLYRVKYENIDRGKSRITLLS